MVLRKLLVSKRCIGDDFPIGDVNICGGSIDKTKKEKSMSLIACEVCTTLLDTDEVETVIWDGLNPLCVDCAEEFNIQEIE